MNHLTTLRTLPRFAALLAVLAISGATTMSVLQPACRADEPGDKTYSVKLFHPAHVGDKYDLSSSSKRDIHNEITVGNAQPILQNQNIAVHLDGTMEVLAVDSKAHATKLTCTIKKFMHTDGKDAEILPPGTVVTAESNPNPAGPGAEKTLFSLKEGALTPDQSAALQLVIETHIPESATDDEVFGTDKPQKIGATWPMDVAKAAADAAKSGLTIKPEDMKGDVTLVGTEKVDDTEYLRVKARTSATNLTLPMPNGIKVADGAKLEVTMNGLFLPNGSLFSPSEAMEMSMELRATGAAPDGSAIAMHMTMKGSRESKSSPVKP